ncbi:hypothetical protein SpCBS45565_g06263 [Spizellomyces sp. 'palustris']|nr:hypothetical protein SpCBS45565_g06263 [Spizellomyces sp. 'palustris']
MTIESLWQTHRRTRGAPPKAVPSRFHSDCVISYVPTGTTYRGHREIEVLLEQIRTTYFCVEDTKVLSTIYGENDVVEESLLTVRHERPMEYLLPGVKDTGRTLKVAQITVSTFRGDKLASQRVYWDHASVLRQAGLLPQSVRGRTGGEIPVKVAGNDVENVVKAAFEVEGLKGDAQLPVQSSLETLEVQEAPVAPPQDTYVKHHENEWVGSGQPEDVKPTGNGEPVDQTSNVANVSNPVTGKRQSVRLHAPPGGVSQISLATGNDLPRVNRRSDTTPRDSDMMATRNSYAARDRGSIGFATSAERPPAAAPLPAKGQAPPVTGQRVSVKLHAPPGGTSQIFFG